MGISFRFMPLSFTGMPLEHISRAGCI